MTVFNKQFLIMIIYQGPQNCKVRTYSRRKYRFVQGFIVNCSTIAVTNTQNAFSAIRV